MDKRLINDIEPCPFGIETVMDLKPVLFQRKNSVNEKKEIGLVSQEVPLHYLKTKNMNGIENVNYEDIIPILIKAIQDLNTEIIKLKEQKQKKKDV